LVENGSAPCWSRVDRGHIAARRAAGRTSQLQISSQGSRRLQRGANIQEDPRGCPENTANEVTSTRVSTTTTTRTTTTSSGLRMGRRRAGAASTEDTSPPAEPPVADRSGGGKKRQRAAGTRARKNLSLLFESESDADTTISPPSERRETTSSSSFVPAEPTFDPNRTQKYMRNKDVRALFKAATGRVAIQAAARVSSSTSSAGDDTIEMTSATRRAVQKSLQRRKIQYPGIAPLPEDLVDVNTVADIAALPALMDLVL
ncbi:hypothetical protein PRIPAC_92130, partial [Pristionchus pacificus]